MPKKLTALVREAVAKSQTKEGRRELREQPKTPEKPTGDPRLDAILGRIAANVATQEAGKAAEAAIEPQSGPESGRSDSSRGKGRGESAENAPEAPGVRPVKRPDPILPRIRVEEHPSREAARLAFGGLVDGRDDLPKLGQLPLFRAPDGPRVPLLELADARGGPIMARGRGAPLDLRLLVAACVMLPLERRADERGVPLPVTVRELRDFCFPNGWQRGRDWPRLRTALKRLHNHAIPGPFHWPGRGIVRDWVPVAVRGGAAADAQLDDVVVLHVLLPPGSPSGPVIEAGKLFQLGVHSAPRFRAYIAAYHLAWRPGVTRRPHPRNRRFHMWSSDPGNYLVLTAEDRDRLAFGSADTVRSRSRAHKDKPWEDLPGVEILTRKASTPDGGRGWLVVPEEAATAVREGTRATTGGKDLPNRRKGPT